MNEPTPDNATSSTPTRPQEKGFVAGVIVQHVSTGRYGIIQADALYPSGHFFTKKGTIGRDARTDFTIFPHTVQNFLIA